MQHKSLSHVQCPIARSLEHVGEWWSMMILRDAFMGLTRFDQFAASLEIAPNMLTRRLTALVKSGLLERKLYSQKPKRYEYVLTPRGRDFRPVLWAMITWGTEHFFPDGAPIVLVDEATGKVVEPVLVDRSNGRPLVESSVRAAPGPKASRATRERYAYAAELRAAREAGVTS